MPHSAKGPVLNRPWSFDRILVSMLLFLTIASTQDLPRQYNEISMDKFSQNQLIVMMYNKLEALDNNVNSQMTSMKHDMDQLKKSIESSRQQNVDALDLLSARFNSMAREFNQTKVNFESSWQTQREIKIKVDNTFEKLDGGLVETHRVMGYHHQDLKERINGVNHKTTETKVTLSNELEDKFESTKQLIQAGNTDFLNKVDASMKQTNTLISSQTSYLETKVKGVRTEIAYDFQTPMKKFVRTAEQIYKKSDEISHAVDLKTGKISDTIFVLTNQTYTLQNSMTTGSDKLKFVIGDSLRKQAINIENKFTAISEKLHNDYNGLRSNINKEIKTTKHELMMTNKKNAKFHSDYLRAFNYNLTKFEAENTAIIRDENKASYLSLKNFNDKMLNKVLSKSKKWVLGDTDILVIK